MRSNLNLTFTNIKKELNSKFLEACWRMNLFEVKQLIDAEVDVHHDYDKAIWIAVHLGSLDLVKLLVENGADMNMNNVSNYNRDQNPRSCLSALSYAELIVYENGWKIGLPAKDEEERSRVHIYDYLKRVNRKQKILNLG